MATTWIQEAKLDPDRSTDLFELAEAIQVAGADEARIVEVVTEDGDGDVLIEGRYDLDDAPHGWVRVARIESDYGDPWQSAQKVAAALTDGTYRVANDYSNGGIFVEEHIDD